MAENTITIPTDMFVELTRKAERIATVERMVNGGTYVGATEMLTVLGIERKAREDVG